MQIGEGKIGSVGKYDVEFKDGELVVEAEVNGGAGSITLKIKAEVVLDAIAKAIPGEIDNAIIGVIKAALIK